MSSSLHPQHHLHIRCLEKEEEKERVGRLADVQVKEEELHLNYK